MGNKLKKRGRVAVLAVTATVLVVVTAVYVWPLHDNELHQAPVAGWSFEEAKREGNAAVAADLADPRVLPECRTSLRTRGERSAKAILLLHGYTDCPKQFDAFAEHLFAQGYTVYVPRAPRHGFVLGESDRGLTAAELTGWANEGMNVVAGLGQETGVAGISGGAVLATWLAAERPDAVSRLLLMSPFYRPSTSRAPALAIKPVTVLWGSGLLPDVQVPGTGQSFGGLAQYLRLVANIDDDAVNERLESVAVVTAGGDDQIDLGRAVELPGRLAEANGLRAGQLRLDPPFAHDLVEPTQPFISGTYPAYQKLYETGQA